VGRTFLSAAVAVAFPGSAVVVSGPGGGEGVVAMQDCEAHTFDEEVKRIA